MNDPELSATLHDFLAGKRDLDLPFRLELDGKVVHCEQILRLLPSKRLVVKARLDGRTCVLKLFSNRHKGRRELVREQRGHQWARQAGLTVADIMLTTSTAMVSAVVYDFIEHATPLTMDAAGQVDAVLHYLAGMHQQGLYQQDIHPDNLLQAEQQIYLIDLASVMAPRPKQALTKKQSLQNLALFFAQFDVLTQQRLLLSLSVYFSARHWRYTAAEHTHFVRRLRTIWLKRQRDYLQKCFRHCTMTVYEKTWHYRAAFRRQFWQGRSVSDVLAEIEQAFHHASVLKAGNTATVIHTTLAGHQVVIKRYNIKNIWHWLSHCWRTSRAAISWRNANLLEFIGIATPRPWGFIEKRQGGVRNTAYFISAYEDAEPLLDVYQRRKPTIQEQQQVATLFQQLRYAKVRHGDMKAQNLLLDTTGKIWLIDLDAMQQCHGRKAAAKAWEKDRQRFLKNWTDAEMKISWQQILETKKTR